MEKQTFGSMIATLRKKHGMTQLELAERIGVTVLSFLNELSLNSAISMLGIGLSCIAMKELMERNE